MEQIGDITERISPYSTFKIPLALMGFEEGILQDQDHPVFPYRPEYASRFPFPIPERWQQDTNPTSWMKNSCVWYSWEITQRLGMEKFREYVKKLRYGNQDAEGKNGNGLTHAWLGTSLKISAQEQVQLLRQLYEGTLPFREDTQAKTRALIYNETLPDGWELYGKTGGGYAFGWFVGWVAQGKRVLFFAHYIEDNPQKEVSPGQVAKQMLLERIKKHLYPI